MARVRDSGGARRDGPAPPAGAGVAHSRAQLTDGVQVRNLTKVYEPSPLWLKFLLRTAISSSVTALDSFSLDVGPGDICAIVGPNGAGKSTFFRILTGLTTATSGEATVMGVDVGRNPLAVRKLVGFMPAGDQTIYLRHSCTDNLVFHGRLQGIPERVLAGRVADVLDLVGLGHARDRVGFALSAGMRARLQLARALLHEPRVLILDEPTGAVDPVGSYELLEIVQDVARSRGVPILISSHRLEEIEALHDHVALLDRGKLVYYGSLDVLRQRWQRPTLELQFRDPMCTAHALDALRQVAELAAFPVDARSISVSTTADAGFVLSKLDGTLTGLTSVTQTAMPLRDLLAKMLGAGQAPTAADADAGGATDGDAVPAPPPPADGSSRRARRRASRQTERPEVGRPAPDLRRLVNRELRRYPIAAALGVELPSVGPDLARRLAAFGVMTAADIDADVGPVLPGAATVIGLEAYHVAELRIWRRVLESQVTEALTVLTSRDETE